MTGATNNGTPTTGTAPASSQTTFGSQSAMAFTSTKPNGPCGKSPMNGNVVGSSGRSGGGGSGTAPSIRTSRRKSPGLFNGFWYTHDGKKIRQIWRSEYGELYRLHTLGKDLGLQKEERPTR